MQLIVVCSRWLVLCGITWDNCGPWCERVWDVFIRDTQPSSGLGGMGTPTFSYGWLTWLCFVISSKLWYYVLSWHYSHVGVVHVVGTPLAQIGVWYLHHVQLVAQQVIIEVFVFASQCVRGHTRFNNTTQTSLSRLRVLAMHTNIMACGHAKMGLPNLGVVKPKATPLSLRELGCIAGEGVCLHLRETNMGCLPMT